MIGLGSGGSSVPNALVQLLGLLSDPEASRKQLAELIAARDEADKAAAAAATAQVELDRRQKRIEDREVACEKHEAHLTEQDRRLNERASTLEAAEARLPDLREWQRQIGAREASVANGEAALVRAEADHRTKVAAFEVRCEKLRKIMGGPD